MNVYRFGRIWPGHAFVFNGKSLWGSLTVRSLFGSFFHFSGVFWKVSHLRESKSNAWNTASVLARREHTQTGRNSPKTIPFVVIYLWKDAHVPSDVSVYVVRLTGSVTTLCVIWDLRRLLRFCSMRCHKPLPIFRMNLVPLFFCLCTEDRINRFFRNVSIYPQNIRSHIQVDCRLSKL